jgi:hypothetical protein
MHNVNFGFIPLADIQSTLSPTCREDPLGLPSAAWPLAYDDSNRTYPIHHPLSPTCREDPLGLPSAAWALVNDDSNRMYPILMLGDGSIKIDSQVLVLGCLLRTPKFLPHPQQKAPNKFARIPKNPYLCLNRK